MESVILPYGQAGWIEKIRTIGELLSSRPHGHFVYNDVLIIVSSSRMKRMYGRLLLDLAERNGSAALVQPEIQTLHQFFDRVYSLLNAPRLIDENSRLVLIEGLVKERLNDTPLFNQSPDLLAPSLSSAIAKMIEQLAGAGVGPDLLLQKINDSEFFEKPQVRLLLDVYNQYLSLLKRNTLVDPAGMRKYLLDNFDPAWLAPYRRIFIDGILDAGALEAGILRKLVASGHGTYFVEAPEADVLDRASEFHPLRVTRDFFSTIGITPLDGGAALNGDDLFLARTLFSDKPFDEITKIAPGPATFSKKMALLSAINQREEVTLIAGMVKRSLKTGTEPDSILVAFPALDEYGPLVEEIFNDYGIPYNRALGRQLSTSPVVTAVVSLLRACQEDFSGPSLLRVFSSSFLKFAENRTIAPALDGLLRDKRLTGGKDKLLSALHYHIPGEDGKDILTAPLTELFAALDPFSTKDPAALSLWMERLETLMNWSGLSARVDVIHGPLNVNLQAYKKLVETLASLNRAGAVFPDYSYTFNEWLFLIKKTFMHTRFQVPPEDEGGVQVLGIEESMGHPWNEIYLGGLVDGKFPQRLPQNIFLPEQTLESMGVRTLEKARMSAAYHFYRLLLSAKMVTLTYPENEGDRPTVTSPFLMELTPLRNAGLIRERSHIQFSLKIEDSMSLPELAKSIALQGKIKGLVDILNTGIEGTAGIRSAVASPPSELATAIPPPGKREFWVTELDAYLNCPYDYYVTNMLALEPLEDVTEDISPLDRGSKVHTILRNFYLSWTQPITSKNRADAKELLRSLAGSAFDREADTVRNRREKDIFLNVMAERFLDAEEEFWKQGMRPAYLEQKIEDFRLTLSNGEIVSINGKIDRIDVDNNGNFVIVDYKSGKYPQPTKGMEQEIFQLPAYAVMAMHTMRAQSTAPLRKPVGLAYYDLRGKYKGSARDVVLYNKDLGINHPSKKPQASPKSSEEFESILTMSMEKAKEAIEGILMGNFFAEPRNINKCRLCPNEMMCEKKGP